MRCLNWFSLRALVILGAALSVTVAAPSGQDNQERATAPSADPFYQPPAGFESQAPGAILKQRRIVASYLGLLPNPVEAYQLLYRTTAINGSAIATVTTVFKPFNAKTDRFVSFQTAYDSAATVCNPSYTYQLGAPQTDLITSAETLILQVYLSLGYIVSSPDYEGPDAAFAVGRLEGTGVLDSMRAVSNFKSTLRLSTSKPMIVGVGYSGGAIATGWAASLLSKYAPELPVKGWVSGGTPANLTGTATFIDNTLFSGFFPVAIAGLAKPSAYREQIQPLLDRIATPLGRSKIAYADTHCVVDDLINAPYESIQSTAYQSLGPGLLYDPTVVSILVQNIMGIRKSETPAAPVFLYHATQDEIIPYANASTLNTAWCKYGANVKFTTYANGGHLTTEIVAVVNSVQFVQSAFAGTTAKGCSQNTELSSVLNPLALGVQLEPILIQLINVLYMLGQGDKNFKGNLSVLKKTVST